MLCPEVAERPGKAARVLLTATRVWLPAAIAVVGIVAIVLGHGHTAVAGAGVVLVGIGLIVWMINWMFRMSVESNRDREREEEAREYFDRHGRWPGDEDDG
jgi:ABC-type transport system involved in cytochrome bd biosynthesis fused ATPase/permease subunit